MSDTQDGHSGDEVALKLPMYFLATEILVAEPIRKDLPSLPVGMDLVTITPNVDASKRGVAVWTDREGAEQYRDEQFPDHHVFPLLTAGELLAFLESAKRFHKHTMVALDPYRPGRKLGFLPIEVMISMAKGEMD